MALFKRLVPILMGALAVVVLTAPQPAKAAFGLDVYVNGSLAHHYQIASSNGTISDAGANYTDGTDTFTVSFVAVSSSSPDAVGGISLSSLNVVFASGSGTGTIEFRYSAQDFSTPSGPCNLNKAGTLQIDAASPNNSTITGTLLGYADNSNTLFGTPAPIAEVDLLVKDKVGENVASGVTSVPVTTAGSYSLTNSTTLTFSRVGTTLQTGSSSTTVTAVAVPEPSAVVLALAGLPFVGAGWVRLRRKNG